MSGRAGSHRSPSWGRALSGAPVSPATLQQLEKALAQARRELEAVQAGQAVQQQVDTLQQQVAALRQQLAAARERQASAESLLKGKAAALAASEKRLRLFETAMQRLAAKQGGADAWRIGANVAA